MRARRLMTLAAAVAVALAAAGCGGGSSSDNGGGGSGAVKEGGIFTLGSTNYIDTLNVFNYIEAGATISFLEIYPELVQYGPGLKEIVPSFAESWTVSPDGKTYTFKLRSGREVVGRPAAHVRGRCLDSEHDHQVPGPDGGARLVGRACDEGGCARPDHGRLPLRQAGRERAGTADVPVHPAQARVGEVHGQQRQGSEDLPAGGSPSGRVRWAVPGDQVRQEGPDRLQAQPGLVGPEAARRRGRLRLLHQRRLDDRRPPVGPDLGRRPGAVHGGERGQEDRASGDRDLSRAARSRTSPGTRIRTNPSTGSCSTRR